MKIPWRARRRWSLLILLVGMPLYVVAAVTLLNRFGRPSVLTEFAIYVGLGFLWALPFRFVFRGVARPEPKEKHTGEGLAIRESSTET